MEILNEIEAAEDEILLEELDWSKVGNDPKEIQVALAVQSETLNTEIIDFLLQWEEDENVNKALPDSKRVRDTFEVLNALSQVDNELECVDVWISDQIERLSQVKLFRMPICSDFYFEEERSAEKSLLCHNDGLRTFRIGTFMISLSLSLFLHRFNHDCL
jgi:hypothetical protein